MKSLSVFTKDLGAALKSKGADSDDCHPIYSGDV